MDKDSLAEMSLYQQMRHIVDNFTNMDVIATSSIGMSSVVDSRNIDHETRHEPRHEHVSSSYLQGQLVPVNLLRRYIEYARIHIQPQLTKPAAKVLQVFIYIPSVVILVM